MSTRSKITHGLSWNTFTVVFQVLIQLVYTGILARMLVPGDFAVMGVVLGLMGFAEIFSQVGIGPALVQRKEIHPQHLSGAFYTALLMGIAFTLLFFFLAPWFETLYGMAGLTDIIRVVSTSFLISAIGVVPRSLMIKELAFKRFFTAGMISIIGGNLIIGLALAYSGYGVWAYVWALFAQNTIMTIAYWILHPVRIPLSWKGSYTRELIRYGAGSTLFNALNYAATKVDVTLTPLFAAKAAGADLNESLRRSGLYERSAYLVSLPITIMGKLSDNVMFSGMAAMQDDTARLKKSILIANHFLGLAIIPIVCFAICFAPEIILLYLGDQYAGAIPILQVLLSAVIFRTLSRIADSLLRARDATFQGSWVKAVYLTLMIVGVIIGATYGMIWVAAAISLTTAIHLVMSMSLCKKLIGSSMKSQLKSTLPGWIIGMSILLTGFPLSFGLRYFELPHLAVLTAGSLIAFMLAIFILLRAPFLLGKGEMNLIRFLPARIRSLPLIRRMDNS